MYNITLISSFHLIQGKCNPDELYKILEKLQPQVIFEELSDKGFEIIYSPLYQPQTIEAIAIKRYLQQYPIKHFPVDNYPVSENDLLSDPKIIWDNSSDYRDLWIQLLKIISERGYYFLNSHECTEVLDRLATIEESVLSELNNLELLSQLNTEKSLHEKRETQMLRTIFSIANKYPFDKAIFICGAEHRQGIKMKIRDFEVNEQIKLNWTFFNEP